MTLNFKFAVISDLHIALPQTIWHRPNRCHLVEVSIPAFEQILRDLVADRPDFLLLPGDLVQHGEWENHQWLAERLAQLPFPTYAVPGNHDVVRQWGNVAGGSTQPKEESDNRPDGRPDDKPDRDQISLADFPQIYQQFGYADGQQLYYQQEILPGVHLIGLNSNAFDHSGEQLGFGLIDAQQLAWLDAQLLDLAGKFVMVMVHHNTLEHLPHQATSELGQRYMIQNAPALVARLQKAGVPVAFTGHLHVQDIAQADDFYAITTGSLVSYPHPYRLLSLTTDSSGQRQLQVESKRVEAVPDWPTLQETSRAWMGDRSFRFILKLLLDPPLSLSVDQAKTYAPYIQDFWATVTAGDAVFDYPMLPEKVQQYFQQYSAVDSRGELRLIDNQAVLTLN
ncbi:MAG: metallophosphoesterase [Phormidesmis priestleyi]|uniref:Metallophosphoesterase n=1 Tax=Phormidesmis priestleyi TaxID=268141 RepID=A0A2W4YSQ2_9CYAN|nr:MAG: metallophosphoesterase [Phormidesmis priestleyi]